MTRRKLPLLGESVDLGWTEPPGARYSTFHVRCHITSWRNQQPRGAQITAPVEMMSGRSLWSDYPPSGVVELRASIDDGCIILTQIQGLLKNDDEGKIEDTEGSSLSKLNIKRKFPGQRQQQW